MDVTDDLAIIQLLRITQEVPVKDLFLPTGLDWRPCAKLYHQDRAKVIRGMDMDGPQDDEGSESSQGTSKKATLGFRERRLVDAAEHIFRLNTDFVTKRLESLLKLSQKQVKNLRRNKEYILKTSQQTQENALDIYRRFGGKRSSLSVLYDTGLGLLNAKDAQNSLAAYVGRYHAYRLANSAGGLVKGLFDIAYRDDHEGYFFRHISHQTKPNDPSGKAHELVHEGPVYGLTGRLYFVGLGVDLEGCYLRPMIMRAVDQPHRKPLIGIVLTETFEHIPLASKTVLVHEQYLKVLAASFGNGPKLDEHICSLLKSESVNNDIVFGWSENHGANPAE
ncbi:MAG: hypothetical protein APF80_11875 [Alphaproteobacteria bacterium BRH_c36]|nr:MAG: hypothetical protein APF80_11875 [Alphaproteobacteria bacterium BRH_c36]